MKKHKIEVLILTEGGKHIGFGHVIRCMALYQAFLSYDIPIKLVVNGDDSLIELLNGKKYELYNWQNGYEWLSKNITENTVVIVDSYQAPLEVYNYIAEKSKLAVYLDDIRRLDYPSGVVINSAICAEQELNYPKNSYVNYLLGPEYTLQREDFWDIESKVIRPQISSIMLISGGDDSENLMPYLVSFMARNYPEFIKNVVIGKGFKNISEIEKVSDDSTNFIMFPDASLMLENMLTSDLAISAAGQTLYELARVGTPTIAIGVAPNQRYNILGWERTGFIEFAGWWDGLALSDSLSEKISILKEFNERERRSQIGRKTIDGKGALRVAETILAELS